MSDTVIKVSGLGKQYRIGVGAKPYKTIRESLTDLALAPLRRFQAGRTSVGAESTAGTFWALKDVDFEVKQGEVLGIIGRNGAGKSTLLKILSRITEPTLGQIEIDGRVGSLLEVGTGFHPELTGRENIYLNGAILGMKRQEIANKFDEIVAFAETEKFLDTPVKYYSSGMYTRLAFAVAAHLEPEILIVDEVLAVGDVEFQRKCMGKMGEVASAGRTVLFVSHNIAAIQNLCNRGILLSSGRVETLGPINGVIERYREMTERSGAGLVADRADRVGSQRARVESIELLDTEGKPIPAILAGVPFRFRVTGFAREALERFEAAIDLDTIDGIRVTTLCSGFVGTGFQGLNGRFVLECDVAGLDLRPDRYHINVWFGTNVEALDFVTKAAVLEVATSDFQGGGRIPLREHGPLLARYRWNQPAR